MELTMSQTMLQRLLQDAADLGAQRAMQSVGAIKPYLSKAEAYKMYGEYTVERWIKEGLITPRKDGTHSSKWRIDRIEIEAISKTSNRPSYLKIKYTP
ncbi:helix-turn-helix domain-containing protein [Pedobacter cryotolerans]|uniref:Helix-turn-helix domain-containing protein n=1 Tax=Pedobacter cryotolerans TaxID=2571270 RepID=A0A4U1C702_9SPHI|nr:helix-turn-helix domain-containing protein [Pedobacter cryotolerans]TKC01221.1 helix-turn-helix domain-containing protein [Pedobacter cryotolerans]